MIREDVWNEYMSPVWIAQNGLGRLDPYPESPLDGGAIDGNGEECVRNENGILFLSLFLLTTNVAGLPIHGYVKKFNETVEKLVRKPYRGLFNRRPYGDMEVTRHEAHDNYAAICGMGALYGIEYAKEVLSYGHANGYMYNNVNPDRYELKQVRQNGEIAFYQICARYTPGIIEFTWLLVGILINCFKGGAGETQLAWLRLYCISRIGIQNKVYALSFLFVSELWKFMKNRQFGSLSAVYKEYFKEYHPIHKMASFIPKGEWGF